MSTTSGIGFSVITPAYRTERYVAETIESVLRQTRADWELIVVDNGPSDEMARIVESYMSDTRIRLIRQDNNGIGGARNVAAREAHGRYLTCLDSDDQLLPAYFAEVGQILDRRPDVAMVSCDALVFLEEKGRLATQTYLKGMRVRTPALDDPEHVLANLLSRNFIYAGATVRRSTLEAIGGFAEDLPGLEDWDTWLRVAGTRQGIAVVGQPLAIYRHRSDSASRNTDRLDSFELTSDATLVRALECLDLSGEQRRIARRGLADIRAHRALRLAREALLAGDDQLAPRTSTPLLLGSPESAERPGSWWSPAVSDAHAAPSPTQESLPGVDLRRARAPTSGECVDAATSVAQARGQDSITADNAPDGQRSARGRCHLQYPLPRLRNGVLDRRVHPLGSRPNAP